MGARDQKFDRISLFHVILVISGIILNVVLANITGSMGLPIFLDSIGTILVAWQCGMISGVLTALVSSFICGLFSPLSIYYSLVNIMMALLTSGFSFKGILEKRIGKLYLILGLTAVGGLFGSIIEWLLNGEPDRFYMIKMTENFSNNMRISVFSAFLLLSIFFSFIDKVITVLIAWGVSTFIPKYVSETIWYRTLQKDYKISKDDSFRDDESYKKRRKIRVKLLVILAAEAILLTIIIAWVSVSIYMDFTRRDRIEVANGQAKSVAGIVDGDYIDDYIEERGQSEEYELT
nr:hypothetical protein [Lachnospiraceae bacterium]